ncbi:MFS transporter [Paracidovorax oryzae]|uniref:MFS transporter n=1 Tax=Paracidovorax oryzae TaxID=862720 RepID=UPI0035D10F7D
MTSACSLPQPADPSLAIRSRHRWKVLAAGVFANAAFSVAFSGIPMTAVLMRTSYQLDNATLGWMLGMLGLGIAVSELPWGMLTDRWGDRPVLLAGLMGTALALAAMALWAVPSPGHLPAPAWVGCGLMLVGLTGGSVNGASGRAIMLWFPDGERGLAMSIRQTAVPLGGAIGALLLPLLAVRGGFVAVYGVLSALSLAAAGLAWAWVREPSRTQARPRWPAAIAADRTGPLRNAGAWRLAAGIGILCAPQFAVLSFGTVFLHDFAHAQLASISMTLALVQAGAMVMRVWSGRWTDRKRNRPAYLRACCGLSVLLFAGLAVASVWGAALHSDGVPLRLFLMSLLAACGICISAWHGVAYTELAVRVGATHAGTALGMANTSVFVVCFVVPLAIPHLLALQGWALVWSLAVLCAWAGGRLLVGRSPPRP